MDSPDCNCFAVQLQSRKYETFFLSVDSVGNKSIAARVIFLLIHFIFSNDFHANTRHVPGTTSRIALSAAAAAADRLYSGLVSKVRPLQARRSSICAFMLVVCTRALGRALGSYVVRIRMYVRTTYVKLVPMT